MTKIKATKILTLTLIVGIFGIIGSVSFSNAAEEKIIPEWIQSVASYWSNGDVSDQEFVGAMEFLVDAGIMDLPNTVSAAEAQTITSSLEEMSERLEAVEAQAPIATGTTVAAPTTPNQPPTGDTSYSPICPSDMVQHWDKVVFTISDQSIDYIKTDNKDVKNSIINKGDVVDMKFYDTQTEVDEFTNLKSKVWQRLNNEMGFYAPHPDQHLDSFDIEIIDVEYAIVCAYPPGAVEHAIPAPMK